VNRSQVEIRTDSKTATPIADTSADALLQRLKAEFLEMPGLKLTGPQACRLWALDAASCSALLDALMNENFLFKTRDGAFMRIEGAVPSKASPAGRSATPKKPASAA
jgi:hypothetical protein